MKNNNKTIQFIIYNKGLILFILLLILFIICANYWASKNNDFYNNIKLQKNYKEIERERF